MSAVSKYVQRFSSRDFPLTHVNLVNNGIVDSQMDELINCILVHSNTITAISLSYNKLTDEAGVKLAQYVAASPAITSLDLEDNKLNTPTYLAVAAALRVNSSLKYLYLLANTAIDVTRINTAFVEALRLNPNRPDDSMWLLYFPSNKFKKLKYKAEKTTPPSMLEFLLYVHLDTEKN